MDATEPFRVRRHRKELHWCDQETQWWWGTEPHQGARGAMKEAESVDTMCAGGGQSQQQVSQGLRLKRCGGGEQQVSQGLKPWGRPR